MPISFIKLPIIVLSTRIIYCSNEIVLYKIKGGGIAEPMSDAYNNSGYWKVVITNSVGMITAAPPPPPRPLCSPSLNPVHNQGVLSRNRPRPNCHHGN